MCKHGEETVIKLLNKWLGMEAIGTIKHGTGTQKEPSLNHAISKGTLTLARNGPCRDHSTMHYGQQPSR